MEYTGPLTEKLCSACKLTKPVAEFDSRGRDQKHILKTHCRICHRKRMTDQYARNREKYRASARLKNEAVRLPNRIYVQAYFETHPCVDCGMADWRVLEFDHVRGEKWKNICDIMMKPLDVVVVEIEKCDSVCANCHKLRTYKRANSWRFRGVD